MTDVASFTYAKQYHITAQCTSPLRTGDVSGDNSLILHTSEGIPMIQAASIAGVLRSWFKEESISKELFGDSNDSGKEDQTSSVTVSDGIFQDTATIIRPRLRIDSRTGAGMNQHKFELTSVPPGAEFQFSLLLKTQGKNIVLETKLEEALSALNQGLLTLGGQHSNGFGQVKLTKILTHSYDLTTEQGRTDWLDDAKCQTPLVNLPDVCKDNEKVTFCLTGVSDHFLVKSGKTEKRIIQKNDKQQTQSVTSAMKNPDGSYVLPGSSLKGVLRSRVERIAAYKNVPNQVEALFGREAVGEDEDGLAGQLCVREFTMKNPKQQCITRTRLDKFTGGVMQKSLFTEETLSNKVQITLEVEKAEPEGYALLFYAFRDLAMGLYGFGSENGVGRGYFKPEHSKLTVQKGQQNCTFTFGANLKAAGNTGFIKNWLEALDKKEEN
jgi:CRISPR/Cas system CSM-associated protein Csm3 (group 7 of RAMP superfamily)